MPGDCSYHVGARFLSIFVMQYFFKAYFVYKVYIVCFKDDLLVKHHFKLT